MRTRSLTLLLALTLTLSATTASAQEGKPPTQEQTREALLRAVRFFHTKVARHGGYLWQYSGDLTLREAEGRVTDARIWVQPPGTPAVGEALLDAYEATQDKAALDAALDAAKVLVRGQMHTGGWGYSIDCDPEKRKEYAYRDNPTARVTRWKRATVLDDDTTTAAIRFLARVDKALGFKDKEIHGAVAYALDALLTAQYPNGAWFGWWEFPPKKVKEADYPVKNASYPESWPRKWSGWPARYVLNDNLVPDAVRTLLDAGAIYREDRHLAAARKAGDFLLRAQLPDPQPAWAQQYDLDMYPCWGRKFEPPAVSGAESQAVIDALLLLFRRTGDKKYLEPVPRALAYLKKSLLPDGRLARFYELKTNKPLFFTKDYQLTYKSDDLPTHYGFFWESRLGAIEAEYKRLLAADPARRDEAPKRDPRALAARARAAIDGLDARGAWVEKGPLRFHRVTPASGVINCRTFVENVKALCAYLSP